MYLLTCFSELWRVYSMLECSEVPPLAAELARPIGASLRGREQDRRANVDDPGELVIGDVAWQSNRGLAFYIFQFFSAI
jgi:hypothetical protein